MTPRDRSAERRVAAFISQNMPAPKNQSEQEPDDLFTVAEKDSATRPLDRRDGIEQNADGSFSSIGFGRSRLPDRFIETGAVAPGSETSRAAADAIGPARRPKAYLVYHHIKSMGRYGATRQELVDALAISLQTICSLVRTLYQCGLIGSNAGHVRANRFSAMANEVMVHEDHVTRWTLDQARPPIRPKWMRGS